MSENNENKIENLPAENTPVKSGFNKKVFFIILGVVTAVCVIVGLAIHGTNIVIHSGLSLIKKENLVPVNETWEIKNANSISLDITMADVEISRGDKYQVEYSGREELKPEVEEKDGELTVKQQSKVAAFSLVKGCKIRVTIPENLTLTEFDLNCDLGNVEMTNLAMNELNVACDLGNIEGKDITVKNDANLAADAGNIEFKNFNCEKLEAAVDAGNIELKDSSFNKGKIECDMGNAVLKGTFYDITGRCSMGNLAVTNSCDTECKYDMEVDLGNLEINGKTYMKEYKN